MCVCVKRGERERERECVCVKREKREKRNIRTAVLAFFITLEFLTPTFPCYKSEVKKLREKTEEAACLKKIAIKFSIGSLCPKFLHLSMHLSLLVT